MRSFDYIKIPEQLLKPEIVQMVGSLSVYPWSKHLRHGKHTLVL